MKNPPNTKTQKPKKHQASTSGGLRASGGPVEGRSLDFYGVWNPGLGSFQRTVLPHQQKREYMNHQIVWCDIPVKDLDRAIILYGEGNRVALHAK